MAASGVSNDFLNAINTRDVSAATKSTMQETEERFLKLLVAQMQNQDPLDPMDNTDLTSVMAQLSTVTGITQLNETVNALMASLSINQTLEATAMIGHGVLVAGDSMVLSKGADTFEDDGVTVKETGASMAVYGFELGSKASNVTIKIYDSSGKVVATETYNDIGAGVHPVTWDGTMSNGDTAPEGVYTFEVVATNNGSDVAATALSFGEVVSVTKGTDNSVYLNVLSVGSITLDMIRQIL